MAYRNVLSEVNHPMNTFRCFGVAALFLAVQPVLAVAQVVHEPGTSYLIFHMHYDGEENVHVKLAAESDSFPERDIGYAGREPGNAFGPKVDVCLVKAVNAGRWRVRTAVNGWGRGGVAIELKNSSEVSTVELAPNMAMAFQYNYKKDLNTIAYLGRDSLDLQGDGLATVLRGSKYGDSSPPSLLGMLAGHPVGTCPKWADLLAASRQASLAAPSENSVSRKESATTYGSVEQDLLALKALFDKGLITKDEYEAKRKEILKRLPE